MNFGPYIFGCAGTRLTREEAAFFAASLPFGFILFARNIDTPQQVSDLIAQLRHAVGWHAPVFIDQEGGRVARLRPPHWTAFPPALDMADAPDSELNLTRAFWLRGRLMAEELHALGIDVNCTPLADIARPDTHAVLRNRCYGFDADTVIRAATALAAGQAAGGVASVLKHMPGHGGATLDSHLALPHVSAPKQMLDAQDFKPFTALNHLTMGMTAHIVFDAIDPAGPATQSPGMIQLIRGDIGFSGLLMTDDISMNALSGTVTERSLASLSAGCDLILHCNGDLGEMRNLAEHLPPMCEAAKTRALRALALRPRHQKIDIAALKAEFADLIRG